MVLIVAVAAVLEGHSEFVGAGIAGERGIGEGVAVVPDLHLLRLIEVVVAIEGDDLDVRLLEVLVRAGGPPEPELVSRPCRSDDAVAREGISVRDR